MKLLLVCALVAACMAYQKESMLENNRIPTDKFEVGSTCDECQSLVKRFVLASHDQAKMRELKMLLNVLCHETSYVEECRVFVNNLDNIIHRLEPYLADAKKVCQNFHMCSNNRLDAFRRIGMLYVKKTIDRVEGYKDFVCDECQFAAKELKTIVEDKEKQAAVRDFFAKEVCIHAGSYRGMCDMLVEEFLPEFFQELDQILADTKKACADLGFCASKGRSSKKLVFITPNNPSAVHPLLQFWEKAKTLDSTHGSILMTCMECKITVDGLLEELIAQRNEISTDLQKPICGGLLPANFTPSCQDFTSMYLPTVLYMTFKQFDGEGVCSKMHTCDQVSLARMNRLSKDETKQLTCKACQGVQEYLKTSVLDKIVQHNAIAFAQQEACAYSPAVMKPLCESTFAGLVPRFMDKLANVADKGLLCQQKC